MRKPAPDIRIKHQVQPGEQELEPQNNFSRMVADGADTGDRVPKDEEARRFDTSSSKDIIK